MQRCGEFVGHLERDWRRSWSCSVNRNRLERHTEIAGSEIDWEERAAGGLSRRWREGKRESLASSRAYGTQVTVIGDSFQGVLTRRRCASARVVGEGFSSSSLLSWSMSSSTVGENVVVAQVSRRSSTLEFAKHHRIDHKITIFGDANKKLHVHHITNPRTVKSSARGIQRCSLCLALILHLLQASRRTSSAVDSNARQLVKARGVKDKNFLRGRFYGHSAPSEL